MACSTSNPLQGLDLVGNNEVAGILGISPSVVSVKTHRGTFPIAPAVVTSCGRRYWHRADVERAKELLAANPETAPAQQEAQS